MAKKKTIIPNEEETTTPIVEKVADPQPQAPVSNTSQQVEEEQKAEEERKKQEENRNQVILGEDGMPKKGVGESNQVEEKKIVDDATINATIAKRKYMETPAEEEIEDEEHLTNALRQLEVENSIANIDPELRKKTMAGLAWRQSADAMNEEIPEIIDIEAKRDENKKILKTIEEIKNEEISEEDQEELDEIDTILYNKKISEIEEELKEENDRALEELGLGPKPKKENEGSNEGDDTETKLEKDAKSEIFDHINNVQKRYDEIIGEITRERNAYTETKRQEIEQNKRASLWTGLGEAAASIINLAGTLGGATSQAYNNYSHTWANKVDVLRKEREAKLEGYKKQMQTLENAKQEIELQKASIKQSMAEAEEKTKTAKYNADARIAEADAGVKKAYIDAQERVDIANINASKEVANKKLEIAWKENQEIFRQNENLQKVCLDQVNKTIDAFVKDNLRQPTEEELNAIIGTSLNTIAAVQEALKPKKRRQEPLPKSN